MTATTAPPSPSPWSGRDFRLVWAGGLVNDTGDWLLRVALPVYVFTETSSGTLTAALFLIELAISVVLGPIAGGLIDRWDLRRTLVVTNLLQAVTLLPLLAVTPDRIWPAFLVAAVQSTLTRINNPAKVALLPRLVGPDQLIAANAANAASESLSRLVGSPLGGVVVELFGLGGVVVADGISFVVVAGATWFVRTDTSRASRATAADAAHGSDTTHLDDVGSTLGMIRRNPALRALVSATTITSVAQGMFVVLYLAFVVRSLGGGGGEIGLIRGVQAIGGVLGSVAIARIATRVSGPTLFAAGLLGMGVVSFVTWNSPPAVDRDDALHRPVRRRRRAGGRGVGRWADDRPAVHTTQSPGAFRRHARRDRLGRDGRRVAGGGRARRPGAARRTAQRPGGAPPVGWRVRGGCDAAPNQSDKVSAAPAAGRRAV